MFRINVFSSVTTEILCILIHLCKSRTYDLEKNLHVIFQLFNSSSLRIFDWIFVIHHGKKDFKKECEVLMINDCRCKSDKMTSNTIIKQKESKNNVGVFKFVKDILTLLVN